MSEEGVHLSAPLTSAMAESELHSTATPPDITQPKVCPSPITTPTKRKLSAMTEHDNSHEINEPIVSQIDSSVLDQPVSTASASRQVGVYMQAISVAGQDLTDDSPQLVAVSTDFSIAHADMLTHMGNEIGKNPQWGAARHLPHDRAWDIVDAHNVVRLQYKLEAIRSTAQDASGNPVDWVREIEWLQKNYAGRPPVHLGLFLDINCNTDKEAKQLFLGGYSCLSEASHAMKTTAHAYVAANSGVRLHERSIELVGEMDEVQQRYVIKDGRWVDGKFVPEEEWLKKELESRDALVLPPSPVSDSAVKKEFGVIPLDTLKTAPATSQDEPRATSEPAVPAPTAPANPSQTPAPAAPPEVPAQDAELFCTCRQPDDGSLMLCCGNDDCTIGWYHGHCVGVKKEPAEDVEWFCPTCVPGVARRVAKKKGASSAKGGKRGQGKKRGAGETAGGTRKKRKTG